MANLSQSIDELRHNGQQWQAFTQQGHCVVLAPPGSGKTKLLTTRLAYDLFNKDPGTAGRGVHHPHQRRRRRTTTAPGTVGRTPPLDTHRGNHA